MPLQRNWLKKSILIPVALAATVATLFLLVLLLTVLSQAARHEFARDIATTRAHWHEDVTHRSNTLLALGRWIGDNVPLRSAGATMNRNELRALAVPLFNDMQEQYKVSCFSLLRTDGSPLLRLGHEGSETNSVISPVLTRAMASGKTQSGIETDHWNKLQLRVAVPWRQGDHLLGYIMLGQSADAILAELDQLFGMKHIVALRRDHAAATDRVQGDPTLLLLESTLVNIPERLRQLLSIPRIAELNEGMTLEQHGRWYHAGLIPLDDQQAQPFGWIVVLRDVSGVRTTLLLSIAVVSVVTLIVLGLLLAFLHRITTQAERQFATVYDELQQSFERLEQAHTEWIESFDAIEQPIFIHDERYRVIRANRAYAERAGMPLPQLLGKPYWEVFPFGEGPLPACRAALEGGRYRHEEEVRLPNGEVYISRAFPIRDSNGNYTYSIHVMQDVTELERLSNALSHENRARRTVSASNQALIHANDEMELLHQVCTVATTLGGYHIAWVGLKHDDAEQTLERVAIAGFGEDDPEIPPLQWNEQAAHTHLSSYAVHRGEVVVLQDVRHNTRFQDTAALAERFDYNSAAAIPLQVDAKTIGVLYIAARPLNAFTDEEVILLKELADDLSFGITALRERRARAQAEHNHLETLEKLRNTLNKTVQGIALAVEARDPYTAGHQQRVSELVAALARVLGWDEERIEAVRVAGIVHDVGNIYVPAEILSKPGKLSAVEFELVKTHAEVGHRILSAIDFPWPVAEMVLQHHERLDGSGYPQGLKNGDIMVEAQLIGAAEQIEAMTSHRPYRPALGIDAALRELEQQRGRKYLPEVVDACIRLFREQDYHIAPAPHLG